MGFSTKRFKRVVDSKGLLPTLWRCALMVVWVIPIHTAGLILERLAVNLESLGFWLQVIGLKAVGKHPLDL